MKDCCADVVNIKISKFGGLTKAKQAIDLCSELGLAMTVEGKTTKLKAQQTLHYAYTRTTHGHVFLKIWGIYVKRRTLNHYKSFTNPFHVEYGGKYSLLCREVF